MSTPSARYQRIASGEIGAAPVPASRQRSSPSIRLVLPSTVHSAMRRRSASQGDTGRRASLQSATASPTAIARRYAQRCNGVASRSAIMTFE